MYWLSIFRIGALAWTFLCALVVLGTGAHTLASASDLLLPTFGWAGLGVATGVLAFPTLPAMLVIDLVRTGAFTSMVVVELSWLGFIGVLLLATGGAAASSASGFWVQCNIWTPAAARTVCAEASAGAAFAFLGWVFIWAYTGTLLTILIIQAQRGNYIWQSSVREIPNTRSNNTGTIPPLMTTAPGLYGPEKTAQAGAVAPQYGYPPQNAFSPQTTGTTQPPPSPQPTGYSSPASTYAPPQQTGHAQTQVGGYDSSPLQASYGQPVQAGAFGQPANVPTYPQV
ncbi:hypothetical protein C8Q74DRAFT_1292456 [Fomes fomentarius]|nr:hypothetical protein C8Q74DRAFT_1292456 [Fomes fomentarius]